MNYAIAASLVLHALILFVPKMSPPEANRSAGPAATSVAPPQRLEARLAPSRRPPVPSPAPQPARPQAPQKQILAMKKSQGQQAASRKPKWTVAEKAEMNDFLRELEHQARTAPTLAQRSKAMARGMAGRQAQQDRDGRAILERIPDSPPVDPFSLEMYLDSLVKKLNQSAGFVKSDPRNRGVKTASVMIRLNPNGSLRSFEILNMADQQDEVAFIKSVVERAVPFAAFPPDLRKSAYSVGMLICIMPPGASGGFGFNRMAEGQGC
ncbi:MAG: hypothetical protein IPL58_09020 [Betaproteobacteria bacterium]|uniref:TonB C-terminal domain-containing protein n=1 Tax=Candidatus Proximibacter danicus TaxID=2954365 RepID=A0A9D7PS13_9PROT|nr:hypothetical protein [Candidatus Proximibacter danicus]